MILGQMWFLRSSIPRVLLMARFSSKNTQPVVKGAEDMLEVVNIDDLPRAQKRFAKQFEKVNSERIREVFAKNSKNHIAFGLLISVAVGIYAYTMIAVKQETFLEEIDEEVAREKQTKTS